MAETAEQLMIRMGFDAMQVKLGLAKMQADNEAAAVRVTAIWKKAETDRRMMTVAEVEATEARVTAIEIEEATRRNRARVLLRQRGLKQEAALAAEQATAFTAISAGSIPANMAGSAERKAAQVAASNIEGAAIGGAVGGGISSGAIRSSISIIKGALIGSMAKMAIGLAKLLHVGVGWSPGVLISSVPVIGAAIAAAYGMKHYAGQMNEAGKVSDESSRNVGLSRAENQKRLRKIVENMAKAGILIPGGQGSVLADINSGNDGRIRGAQKVIGKYLPVGGADQLEKYTSDKGKIAELDKEHKKLVDELYRKEETGQNRLNTTELQRHNVLIEMNKLKKDSVEWHEKQLEVDRLNLDIEQQTKNVAKEKSEIKKSIADKKDEIVKVTEEIGKIDQASPTLAMLAGDKFTSRLDKDYGRGGKWNISDGSGPLGQAARDAALYEKQQMWDLTHGNYAQAEKDRQNQIKAENLLSAAHFETPAMKQAAMQKGIDGINTNIAELLAKAKTDGIVIADKP